jgi:hypothetical protein
MFEVFLPPTLVQDSARDDHIPRPRVTTWLLRLSEHFSEPFTAHKSARRGLAHK